MINLESISSIVISNHETSVDITNVVTLIEIYQNIYEPFVTGKMVIIDVPSSRVMKEFTGGIVGNAEKIEFKLSTRTIPAKGLNNQLDFKDYYVYKVQPLPMQGDQDQSVFKQATILHFCSKGMFTNEFKLVHRSYNDTLSNIVKNISKEYLDIEIKKENIENTTVKQKVIVPYFSPIQSIAWLTARSYTDKNFNFVFYEDINHEHHFTTIGALMAKTPIIGTNESDGIVILSQPESQTVSGKITKQGSFQGLQHEAKEISPLNNATNGMYCSTLLSLDLTRKKFSSKTWSLDDKFSSSDHLYKNQLVDPGKESIFNKVYDNPETVTKLYPKSTYLYNKSEKPKASDNIANNSENYVLERISAMEAMDQFGIEVEIKGNAGIALGEVVFFGRPQVDSVDTLKRRDPFFVGKFLITKIKHIYESQGSSIGPNFRTSLSLRRDSEWRDSIMVADSGGINTGNIGDIGNIGMA